MVGEAGDDFELGAHRTKRFRKCAEEHISALFDFGDLRLVDAHLRGELLLRKLARLAERREVDLMAEIFISFCGASHCLGRNLRHEFRKRSSAWH